MVGRAVGRLTNVSMGCQCRLTQALREGGHWLWESQRGHGGTRGGWFIGDRLLASVTHEGVITGWRLGADQPTLVVASARAGQLELVGPPPDRARSAQALFPPVQRIGPFQAVDQPYLADLDFTTNRPPYPQTFFAGRKSALLPRIAMHWRAESWNESIRF